MTYDSPTTKLKKIVYVVVAFLLMGAWIAYMLWAARIGARTVLMPSTPEWTTPILGGCVIGLIFAIRALYHRPSGKKLKRMTDAFFGGLSIGFICLLHIYDVGTYLLPGDIIHYESEVEITFPGPAFGKHGHCEAGVRIKDINTDRWIELCTTKADLYDQKKRGMNAVWVTAHANKIGSYIVGYAFMYK